MIYCLFANLFRFFVGIILGKVLALVHGYSYRSTSVMKGWTSVSLLLPDGAIFHR